MKLSRFSHTYTNDKEPRKSQSDKTQTRCIPVKPILAALLAICVMPLSAAGFFSGTFEGSINPEFYVSNTWYQLTADSYFAGQIDFSDSFGLKGVLSVQINSGDFFVPVLKSPADLFLGLLAMYFSSQVNGYRHTITFFAGENTAMGTDVWLRQYLNAEKIDSLITRPKIGMWNAGIYPIQGIGMSYTLRLPQPQALDMYIYASRAEKTVNGTKTETDRISFDLRYAGRWDFGIIELFGGATLDTGTMMIGMRQTGVPTPNAYFRAGFTGYFGKPYEGHVYVQTAVVNVDINTHTLSVKDNFFILVEPRFVFDMNRLIFSIFNIPEKCELNKTMLINPLPMGVAASFVFSNSDWQGFEAGITACFSATSNSSTTPGIDIQFDIDNVSLDLVPYVKWNLGPGQVTLSGNITPLEPFKKNVQPPVNPAYKGKPGNHILTIQIGYSCSL